MVTRGRTSQELLLVVGEHDDDVTEELCNYFSERRIPTLRWPRDAERIVIDLYVSETGSCSSRLADLHTGTRVSGIVNRGLRNVEARQAKEDLAMWWAVLAEFQGPVVNRPSHRGFLPGFNRVLPPGWSPPRAGSACGHGGFVKASAPTTQPSLLPSERSANALVIHAGREQVVFATPQVRARIEAALDPLARDVVPESARFSACLLAEVAEGTIELKSFEACPGMRELPASSVARNGLYASVLDWLVDFPENGNAAVHR